MERSRRIDLIQKTLSARERDRRAGVFPMGSAGLCKENGVFGRALRHFMVKRLNSVHFARLKSDPYFPVLDRERLRLENELIGALGSAAMVKIKQYVNARLRCEAVKVIDAYCQGLADGAYFANLFSDPVETLRLEGGSKQVEKENNTLT
ncbi:MAG: hypothetical protein K6U74_04015 [Firmicutes bacterium]|nr:hypothetical protein [Bacillota bacterium]